MHWNHALRAIAGLAIAIVVAQAAEARPLDPEKVAAFLPVKASYLNVKAACISEKINVAMEPVALRVQTPAYIVRFRSSGNCFGNMGENSFITARLAQGWGTLFTAEPGQLDVKNGDVILHSVGMCEVRWRWSDNAYRPRASSACDGLLSPGPVAVVTSDPPPTVLPVQAGTYALKEVACAAADNASMITIEGDQINDAHSRGDIVSSKVVDGAYLIKVKSKGDGGVGGDQTWFFTGAYRVVNTKEFTLDVNGSSRRFRWCRA